MGTTFWGENALLGVKFTYIYGCHLVWVADRECELNPKHRICTDVSKLALLNFLLQELLSVIIRIPAGVYTRYSVDK